MAWEKLAAGRHNLMSVDIFGDAVSSSPGIQIVHYVVRLRPTTTAFQSVSFAIVTLRQARGDTFARHAWPYLYEGYTETAVQTRTPDLTHSPQKDIYIAFMSMDSARSPLQLLGMFLIQCICSLLCNL